MSTTKFVNPVAANKYKNAIIAVLSAGLVIVAGFFIYSNNQGTQTVKQQQSQLSQMSIEKSDVQHSFDASLARLDSMNTVNNGLESSLTEKNSEIAKAKSEIRSILNKKNATASELSRAKNLIAGLNQKIASLEMDVARLTQENQVLTSDNTVLKQDKETLTQSLATTTTIKQNLEKTVDVASTLNASNIVITPINIKKSGKEKVSTTAKKVDKLLLSFDVDNRIIQTGTTDVYVLVIDPEGNPISSNTETFTTRDNASLLYTAKIPVDLETAKKKNVEFGFVSGNSFKQGNYKVQIYQNGFLIGESSRELKKGGLFG